MTASVTVGEMLSLGKRVDRLEEDQSAYIDTILDVRNDCRAMRIDLDKVGRRLDKVERRVNHIAQTADKALGLTVQLGQKRDGLNGRVAVLEADVKELKTDVAGLKTDVGELKTGMVNVTALLGQVLDRLPPKA
jgi:uncharacterized protein (UPF0335 family)